MLYKIIKNNSNVISTESHQQIVPDYEDLITSLKIASSTCAIVFQVIKFIKSLSQTSNAYERFTCCYF